MDINAKEALYGFGAWLTTREKAIVIGRSYRADIMVELIEEWCLTNNLPPVRQDIYPTNIKHPSTEVICKK